MNLAHQAAYLLADLEWRGGLPYRRVAEVVPTDAGGGLCCVVTVLIFFFAIVGILASQKKKPPDYSLRDLPANHPMAQIALLRAEALKNWLDKIQPPPPRKSRDQLIRELTQNYETVVASIDKMSGIDEDTRKAMKNEASVEFAQALGAL